MKANPLKYKQNDNDYFIGDLNFNNYDNMM